MHGMPEDWTPGIGATLAVIGYRYGTHRAAILCAHDGAVVELYNYLMLEAVDRVDYLDKVSTFITAYRLDLLVGSTKMTNDAVIGRTAVAWDQLDKEPGTRVESCGDMILRALIDAHCIATHVVRTKSQPYYSRLNVRTFKAWIGARRIAVRDA